MSEKKPFTVTFTDNETGEVNSYDTNLVLTAIVEGDGTRQICMGKSTDMGDLAYAISGLSQIASRLIDEHPSVLCLLASLSAAEDGEND